MNSQVVLIEDEPELLEIESKMLQNIGITAEPFENALPAWQYIHRGGVRLVITDLEMPNLDGLELLRLIKTLPDPPRVILLTAHGRSLQSLRQGPGLAMNVQMIKDLTRDVFAVLNKPFDLDQLNKTVLAALGLGKTSAHAAQSSGASMAAGSLNSP